MYVGLVPALTPPDQLSINMVPVKVVSGDFTMNLEMTCKPNEEIRVVSARYEGTFCEGAELAEKCKKCYGRTTMNELKKECDEEQQCLVSADSNRFFFNKDYCKGIAGALKVEYKCLPVPGN